MNTEKNYTMWLWAFVGVVLLGAVAAMIKLSYTASLTPNPAVQTVDIASSIVASDFVRNNPTASTTLVEYGDYQCPACGAYHSALKQIEKELGGKFRFIFRDSPLQQHPNARLAAQAAHAAGNQGKFWEMHDMIYETQRDWSEKNKTEAVAIFTSFAAKLKLDADKFSKDLFNNAIIDKIEASFDQGVGFGVDSTPTFFLNNVKLSPQSFADFRDAIANAANATSTR